MKNKTLVAVTTILLSIILFNACQKDDIEIPTVSPEKIVALGKEIFFDKGLSNPVGQSCSSCHNPATAFSDPNHNAVSPGAVDGLFGNRNAPSIAYAMFSPSLYWSTEDSSYKGGFFWDGRVNTLEEQAQKPFLNMLEMDNIDASMVIGKLKNSRTYTLYQQVYGEVGDVDKAFDNIAKALAAYERSAELNPFTSKFDYYLKGQASLSAQELNGLQLFKDTLRAQCTNCHSADPDPVSGKILFTDFTYTNDGVPKNPNNPYYTIPSSFNPLGVNYIDDGIGAFLGNHHFDGEFKVSSLRNIALTAPYFHNGSFNTLEDVVHFYNTRDVPNSGFAPPEVASTVDTVETGNLHLTAQEEAYIVAFLKTLTDGYRP